MCVAKPATQRPKLPSVGRLGLVEPPAPADLDRLGWNTDAHVELLWSLSRAPDADAALRAMVRLADALGRGWDELNHALLKDKGLRGRLFGVLGSSLALGDHLVANPELVAPAGGRRDAAVGRRTARRLRRGTPKRQRTQRLGVQPLRNLYRDRLLVLAGAGPGVDGRERTRPAVHRPSASTCPTWPTPRWAPR